MLRPFSAILLSAALLAAQSDPALQLALSHVSTDRIRADVFFLASPALEGRASGSHAADVTVEWLASEFAKAGLKPVGGTSFKQNVPLIEYRVDRQGSGLTVWAGGKESSFSAPQATVNFPREVTVKAPVVFAGYGISAPALGYDDYAGLDVRGKLVLALAREPQENDAASVFNGKGITMHVSPSVKARYAERRGAVGLLLISPLRQAPQGAREGGPGQQAGGAQRAAAARSASQSLAEGGAGIPVVTVSEQAAAAMLAASGKDIAGIKAAIDKDLKPVAMALAGVEAEVRVVLAESRRTRTVNVVGMIEGSDPKLKDETILLGAHWDHVGVAADGSVYTGADDNASGTAALVETARALAESGAKPRRSIVFAAFAAEERGLLGSSFYAARPPRPLETTRAMINMDMVGRNETPIPSTKSLFEFAADSSNELNIVGTFYSPDLRAAIERANRGAGLDLNYKWDQESSQSIFSRSDQFPFAALGVPAVFFFSGLHPDYHQTRDTPDLINYGKMTKVVKLAVATALDVAGAAAPPRFSEKR